MKKLVPLKSFARLKTLGISLALLFCTSLITGKAHASFYEEAKKVSRSFSIGSNPSLEVINKYGNIDIATWDKDSIRFDIDIKVSSNNLDKLGKMLGNVKIDFRNSSGYVAAETVWGNTGTLVSTAMDIKKILGSADKVTVNYRIFIPVGTDIELSNKFGDVYLPKELNEVEIDVSHGSIRGRNIYNAKNISLKYGKLRLDNLDRGNLDLRFSDASIRKADKLFISSGSSHIDIEEVKTLKLNSKHDRMNIEKVENLNISSSLTDLDVDQLTREITGTIKFGSLKVDEITTGLSGIKLDGNNTDVLLRFNKGVGFLYDVILENGNSFRCPGSLTKDANMSQTDAALYYNGNYGKTGTGLQVTINLKNSYVGFEEND